VAIAPLAFVAGLFTPSPSFGEIRRAVHPSPYRQAMPNQVAVAAAQAPTGMLRGGLSGLTGSEADYQDEQRYADAAIGGPLRAVADDLGRRMPMYTSWYQPNLPDDLIEGRGTGPQTGAYNKGWVILRRLPVWGATTRDSAPHVIGTTLLDPRFRAPLPRDVVVAYNDGHKGATRLEDMFGD